MARSSVILVAPFLVGLAACSPPTKGGAAHPSASGEPLGGPAPSASVATNAPNPSASAAPVEAPPQDAKILKFTRASDSGTVDRIGEKDGEFSPDGKNDLSFDVTLEGSVTALFVAAVDARGGASGAFQADTLTGKEFQPGELALAYQGGKTAGIVVFEGETRLNGANGALPAGTFRNGTRTVRLYIPADSAAKPGKPLRVYALGLTGEIVRGPTLDR
jgi:hypothetical protein